MALIDDRGRLFGVANIIDALVILFVLAVAVAGIALLFGPTETESNSTADSVATVSYIAPSDGTATLLSANDTLAPTRAGTNFTVLDTHYSFTPDGSIHVTARVSYEGTPEINGNEVLTGDRYRLTTGTSRHEVRFLDLNASASEFETTQRSIVVAVDESRQVSHAIEPGDTATIGDRTVARVKSVTGLEDDRSPAELIGAEVTVRTDGDVAYFGGLPVRVNTPITVVTDDALITGHVHALGKMNATAAGGG
ncbi:DUF4330 domain-containing protein [Halobacteriales archaeon Cl-PHB]